MIQNKILKSKHKIFKLAILIIAIVTIIIGYFATYSWTPDYSSKSSMNQTLKGLQMAYFVIAPLISFIIIAMLSDDKINKMFKILYYPPKCIFNNKKNNLNNLLLFPVYLFIQLLYFSLLISLMGLTLFINFITLFIFGAIHNYENKIIGSEKADMKDRKEKFNLLDKTWIIPSKAFPQYNSLLDIVLSPCYAFINMLMWMIYGMELILRVLSYPIIILNKQKS